VVEMEELGMLQPREQDPNLLVNMAGLDGENSGLNC
jgi:hypothetical protein